MLKNPLGSLKRVKNKTMEEILKQKFNGWIDGWVDATGEYFPTMCTNQKSKKKIIEYLNWGISDNYEIREKIFNGFFEVYGFILQDDDIIKK